MRKVRFEVLTAVKIQVKILWAVTLRSVEDGGRKILRNVGILPYDVTTQETWTYVRELEVHSC
jgi:hypothetical protein